MKPSVSWATVLQGTASTIFVEPSGPTVAKPVPVNISPDREGPYALALGVEAAGAGCVVDEGSGIGGGLASGGG